jgi:ankyrin repeat protein
MAKRVSMNWVLSLLVVTLVGCSEPDRPSIELYLAVHRGDINQIERHIHWGTDLNTIDADGRTPLHVAARQGQTSVVKMLLKNGAKPELKDRWGNSALHAAIVAGRTQIADLLAEAGGEVEADRLLDAVVDEGVADRDVIEWLGERNADFNHTDEQGVTPLIRAIKANDRVVVKLLIEAGAEVNRPDENGTMPLEACDPEEGEFICRMLKKHGAVAGRG